MQYIETIASQFNAKAYKSLNCDICHLARQTRQPFQLSNSCSKSIFELIHCDVWGPTGLQHMMVVIHS